MKVLFIGGVYPLENEGEYYLNSKVGLQAAANALQWNMIEGIEYNLGDTINILSGVFIPPYPKGFKKAWVNSYYWKHSDKALNYNISFLNIIIIKNIFRRINIRRYTKKWLKDNKDEEKLIITYSAHVPFLSSLKLTKNKRVKTCLIVPDLPDYTGVAHMKNIFYKLAKKIDVALFNKNLKYVDKFVLLTSQMADRLNCKNNSIVIEGIADIRLANYDIDEEHNTKTVLYSGTLHSEYGIKTLIDSFKYIEDPSYRLIICGDGDSKEYIKQSTKRDNRIIFKGVISRKEVISLQQKVTVLINPRPNEGIYTKYSFPSKTMEYMLSGKPVICFNLDGIPNDYDKHLIYLKELSSKHIAEEIIRVCELDKTERNNIGIQARDFVVENKNKIFQTQKILDFINEK